MPQTPSQEPVDLFQTNDTGHDTNTERIPSPSPTPIREDLSATNTARMPSPNPISTQEDSPATDIKRIPSPSPTSTQDPPTTNPKRMPSSTPTPTQEDPPTSHQPEVVPHEPCEDSSTNLRSSPPPLPSSKTDISSDAPIDTQTKPNGQNTQIEQTQLSQPHEDLGSSKDPLDAHDWTELEERFHAEMEQCANRENGIQEAFDDLLNLFKTWISTGAVHEEQRAGKRLLTRITYVQQREKTLEEKQTHYVKVVKAFENALALLRE